MDGRERRSNAGRLQIDGRLIYDISVLTGVATVTAGVWMNYGTAPALITFGSLVIGLSVFAAERLSGR